MKRAPLVKINPKRISRAAIGSAAGIISGGGVVAYPTETVYGLGASALDPRAVKRIFRMKGRSPDKPLILLVRNLRQVRFLVQEIPPQAKFLMNRFWPDGLTLVMEASDEVPREVLGKGTGIALRISGNRIVRALLDMVRVPLTSPSANLTGRPAPISAEEVQREFGGRVDMIVDGGKAALAAPSTILDVRQEPVRLLREGRIPLDEIQKLVSVQYPDGKAPGTSASILLVCTGNTCRSPMATGMLQKMLRAEGIGRVRVMSAGTQAVDGQLASRSAQQVALAEDGVDLSRHRARQLTPELVEKADLILTMALSHARVIERMGPEYARRTYLLTSFLNSGSDDAEDIEDPAGLSREVYRRTYRRMKRELERIMPALAKAPKSWSMKNWFL